MTEATSGIWPQVADFPESWQNALREEFDKEYMVKLWSCLRKARDQGTVHPNDDRIFKAFNVTPLDRVNVVIIGQDPYPYGGGDGLCFSVRSGVSLDRFSSLKNIFQEINTDMCDLGTVPTGKGCLVPWAEQGVLLLNAMLTVPHKGQGSHRGWKTFTKRVVQVVNQKRKHVVFLLWGEDAIEIGQCVDGHRHKVLEAQHPKMGKKGFFGCRHFSQAREYLKCRGSTPIDWFKVC